MRVRQDPDRVKHRLEVEQGLSHPHVDQVGQPPVGLPGAALRDAALTGQGGGHPHLVDDLRDGEVALES